MQRFEPDQLVLVKYAGNKIWRLRRYSFCDEGCLHETQDGATWDDHHIIPYAGNEQLLGTTGQPAPKWEPKPGELVAVSDNKKDWYPAIFFNAQWDGNGVEYIVNYVHKTAVGFKFCEPLRKHFNVPD